MALEPALSLHRRIQELLLGFSRGITASLSVGGALESLCTTDFFSRRVPSSYSKVCLTALPPVDSVALSISP